MKVGADHWLEGVKRLPYSVGPSMTVRRLAVIHYTEGTTAASSVEWWRQPGAKGAEAHLIIDRDGTVFQIRPFNQECDHAGKALWWDTAAQVLRGVKPGDRLNDFSIGIELANAGNDPDAQKFAAKLPHFAGIETARHRNHLKGPSSQWEKFPAPQLAACLAVTQALCTRYRLDDITGHDCIAPTRKTDPGPMFPMEALRKFCGFTGLPDVQWR